MNIEHKEAMSILRILKENNGLLKERFENWIKFKNYHQSTIKALENRDLIELKNNIYKLTKKGEKQVTDMNRH